MDKALKQRLTGAVILIALAIIFLPILLDGESQTKPRSSIEIPAQPEVNFPTRRLPIGDHLKLPEEQATSPEFDSIEQLLDVVAPPAKSNMVEPAQLDPVIREPSTDAIVITPLQPKDDPVVTTPSEVVAIIEKPVIPTTAGLWQIQIASFAGRSNAEKLVSRLRRTGYQANIDTINRDKLTLHRVIVPGYQDRTAAKLAADSIRKQIEGVNPKVLTPVSATDDAPIPEQAATIRWVVQVGSFSKAENAKNLANKLKQSNYQAFTELSGSIHKVMVGPFVDRSRAELQRTKINKQLKVNGIIRQQP